MIFEYTRLETDLSLLVPWSNEGRFFDDSLKEVEGMTFYDLLEALRARVRSTFADSPEKSRAYEDWLADADVARKSRNNLFHGRWAAVQGCVVNVAGHPCSKQTETRYTIAELEAVLESMRELRRRLAQLRSSCPV